MGMYQRLGLSLGRALQMRGYARMGRKGVRERGAALLISLIFASLLGSALASMAVYGAYKVRQMEADASGHELFEISRAARLYVRDLYRQNPNTIVTAETPTRVDISALKATGYLPNDFGRSMNRSALNQPIYIIMSNWPVGSTAANPETVPATFVYFRGESSRADSQLANRLIGVLRGRSVNITAPTFDFSNALTTGNCRAGSKTVSQWDTGCLSEMEFMMLMSALPTGERPSRFEPGSAIVPTWKVEQPDPRVVMRFPQPESTDYATMLTDMRMGTCEIPYTELQINTTDNSGQRQVVSSGVCQMLGDGVRHGDDNDRFNINQVSNTNIQRMIVAPQTYDRPSTGESPNDYALNISGDMVLDGDLRIFSDMSLVPGQTHRLMIPNGTVMADRNVYVYSENVTSYGQADIGTVERARRLVANELTTPKFEALEPSLHRIDGTYGYNPMIDVTTKTTITGETNITNDTDGDGQVDTGRLIAENINAPVGRLLTTDRDIAGNVQVAGSINTNGSNVTIHVEDDALLLQGGQYAAVIGQISDGGTLAVADPAGYRGLNNNTMISAENTSNYNGTSPIYEISVNNPTNSAACRGSDRVANGCPNRQFVPLGINP